MKFTFVFRFTDGANLLTAANGALGVIAVAMAIQGKVVIAAALIAAAASSDHLDGWIARKFYPNDEEARAFGAHLDTLADAVTFVVAPSAILLVLLGPTFGTIAIATLYSISGISRLAYFEITGSDGGKTYVGLPTTYAAYFLTYFIIAFDSGYIGSTALLSAYTVMLIMKVAFIKFIKPKNYITLGIMPIFQALFIIGTIFY